MHSSRLSPMNFKLLVCIFSISSEYADRHDVSKASVFFNALNAFERNKKVQQRNYDFEERGRARERKKKKQTQKSINKRKV